MDEQLGFIKLFTRPLRSALSEVVQSVSRELLVAAPYIKLTEAKWVCDALGSKEDSQSCNLRILTDIRSDSVLSGSLDLEALAKFYERQDKTEVVSLPRLHAKIYVADSNRALVTSANLTPSGLDYNFEYGICLETPGLVERVKADLNAYARLGSVLDKEELWKLMNVAQDLKGEYQRLTKSTNQRLKSSFSRTLHQAQKKFLSVQVGRRSAQRLFSEAIIYALKQRGPMTTEQLHPMIQSLLPDLCDDNVELIINGQQFGKQWKHTVRNAQQHLKRSGDITLIAKKWSIVAPVNN